ncbi:MAG: hypothetical protein KDC98_04385, partial [Planctomycetes bacterium]|nr:hypothetical protein [Planctomycetota bacterium]
MIRCWNPWLSPAAENPENAMRLLLMLSVFSTPVLAQVSGGPFLAAPIHFTVGPNTTGPTGALPMRELYLERSGFVNLVPSPSFPLPEPDFTMAAMFPGRPASFMINAISSQYCTVGVVYDGATGDAMLDIPGDWGALLFSVSNTSPGTGSNAVTFEAGNDDGAGADVFSLVLPGSTLPAALSCSPIGEAQRAADSEEMGFQAPSSQLPELHDFDAFFSLYETRAVCPGIAPYLVDDPWLFFSLPQSVIAKTNPSSPNYDIALDAYIRPWFGASGPSSASILAIKWDPLRTPPRWVGPAMFLNFSQLGLQRQDDIDALSVDDNGSATSFVLLSLTTTSPTVTAAAPANRILYQLMVDDWQWRGGGLPLAVPGPHVAQPYLYDRDTDGSIREPIAKIAGSDGGGEIDATCDVDPVSNNQTTGIPMGFEVACRTDTPWSVTMSASAVMAPTATAGDCAHAISVAGLDLSGPGPHVSGLLVGYPDPSPAHRI